MKTSDAPRAAGSPLVSDDPVDGMPPGVRLVTLDNDLTVIVREDHSAPVVSAQAWCRAGSIDEGRWLGAGLSHALEHMLFKGTTTRGAGRIDQEVQEAGGYMNAYTSFDRTVFWINVPDTGTRVAIDILCDVMQHATLPGEELAQEKQVILREMDMNRDDPARRSSRRLFETAYTRSPYRFTVIGYPEIFRNIGRDDLVAYYREKYAPNNLFLVVAGDVETEAVVGQIREAFARTPVRPLPPTVLPLEPSQTAPREVIEEAPIELGHCHGSWHIPDVRHPDVPALDVLATLLGGGRSSRLYQRVREKAALVHSVDAWTYTPGGSGLFGVSALVDAERFAAARDAILAEVERMKDGSISTAELGKAVKQFTAGMLATRKTMQGQAQDLGGNWLAAGNLSFSQRYLAAIRKLTPADLQRVARQYLTAENRTFYALLPAGAAPRPVLRVQAAVQAPIQKFELEQGLRLLVKEDHRLPFVDFRAVFLGGVLAESAENNGITQLTGRLMLKGTPTRSAEQIATEIESLGGSLDSYGGNNSFGLNAEVLSGDFAAALDLLGDVVLNAAFPAEELERERAVQLAAIRDQRDQMLPSAVRLMRRTLFGDTGYGLDALGSEASVRRLQTDALREFQRRLAAPNNGVLAIYGDVQTEAVKAAVTAALARWPAGQGLARTDSRALDHAIGRPAKREPTRVLETRDKAQAVIVMGFPGVTFRCPARHALELLHEACSDLGSRLFIRIREKLGLAYYVGAQNVAGLVPGYFAFYAGTAPDKIAQVETELRREVELLRAEGLTEAELRRAKAKIIGQRKIARQDLGGFALATALDELYGVGYANFDAEDARYQALTRESILAAAQEYLEPSQAVVAVVQPAGRP
ncbi:MAG: insulinase family protein [Verrucomicrobia bacterium]|nr:insulinase family protein [Verrucomicrobiota bacterium]